MRALLVLAALLLAGCAVPSTAPPAAQAPALPTFGLPVPVSTDYPGAEPVIAVAPDGTIYVEGIGAGPDGNVNKVSRSDDGGATWIDITPAGPGEERSNDGFVAVSTDGTVYAANVFSLTFQVYRSVDEGATWTKLTLPPMPALMHRHWIVAQNETVHVTIEALPPGFAPWLAGAPSRAEAGSPNEGMYYMRSDDAGETWSAPVQIDPRVNFAGQGNMVVSDDGRRIYVLRYEEDRPVEEYTYADGSWYLLASEDAGASWERRDVFALTGELSTAVPALALDSVGTLYMGWTQQVGDVTRALYAFSRDARAWSDPREPTAAAPGTHAMAWLAARGAGEVGMMWYSAAANGTARAVDAPWFVDYALISGADTDAPSASVVRVTPEPVHHGNICAKGPACGPGEDRSLLDYPWMVYHEGRAHLAFPSTEWDGPSAFAMVAVEASPARN